MKEYFLPVSYATSSQQQLSIAPPLPLQNNVDIKLFIVYKDMLHATMETVQLGLTLPYCVISFGTTWAQENTFKNWMVTMCTFIFDPTWSTHLQRNSGLLFGLWKGWWSSVESPPLHQLSRSVGCLWLPNPLYASNHHLACNLEMRDCLSCYVSTIRFSTEITCILIQNPPAANWSFFLPGWNIVTLICPSLRPSSRAPRSSANRVNISSPV